MDNLLEQRKAADTINAYIKNRGFDENQPRDKDGQWTSLNGDQLSNNNEPQYTDYNGTEIMFEPHFKEYYVGDVQFSSLEKAQKYIDNGGTGDIGGWI